MANGSSKNTFKQFREIAKAWIQTDKRISIQQISRYMRIKENKIADGKAKKYLKPALDS